MFGDEHEQGSFALCVFSLINEQHAQERKVFPTMTLLPSLTTLYTAINESETANQYLGHLQGAHIILDLLLPEIARTDPHLAGALQHTQESIKAMINTQRSACQQTHKEILRRLLALATEIDHQ